LAVAVSGTNEPGPFTTNVAGGPRERHPLLNSAIKEDDSIIFHAGRTRIEFNEPSSSVSAALDDHRWFWTITA
jgi:hypothetical protein